MPLAFCAIGMEAMDVSLPRLAKHAIEMSSSGSRDLEVFTARKVRDAFIAPDRVVNTLTFDTAKEEFFKAEVPYGSIIYREAVEESSGAGADRRRRRIRIRLSSAPRLRESRARTDADRSRTARLMHCDDPFDPHANIAAGTRYLHYLVDRFGDEKIALAAYNAGEGTVERLGGGIPQYPGDNRLPPPRHHAHECSTGNACRTATWPRCGCRPRSCRAPHRQECLCHTSRRMHSHRM